VIPAGFRRNSAAHWLAFGFGSGFSPKAPGTAGTVAAIPVALLLAQLPPLLHGVVLLLALVAGIYCCGKTAHDLGVHDHGGIVWDEFVGYWLTVALLPKTLFWFAAGFVVFRVLDIWKPWPIRIADRSVDGGLGVMLDDVIAGIMACGILLLALSIFK
jgi:phosphatidylglycerophosphatase A